MKNIFKKNQIIITALAIMLVVAGYLRFAGNEGDIPTEVGVNGAQDYSTYSGTASDDLTEGDLVSLENSDLLQGIDEAVVTDISDEDILMVTDNGEIQVDATTTGLEEIETSAPGEAIIVSKTIQANYFINAKLEREQTRALSKERYLEIVNNANLGDDVKTSAVNGLIDMTKNAETENNIETLLEAKGFDDSVVAINEGNIDVIVNAVEITEQDMAIIEDLVIRKTGMKSAEIVITPVVYNE